MQDKSCLLKTQIICYRPSQQHRSITDVSSGSAPNIYRRQSTNLQPPPPIVIFSHLRDYSVSHCFNWSPEIPSCWPATLQANGLCPTAFGTPYTRSVHRPSGREGPSPEAGASGSRRTPGAEREGGDERSSRRSNPLDGRCCLHNHMDTHVLTTIYNTYIVVLCFFPRCQNVLRPYFSLIHDL